MRKALALCMLAASIVVTPVTAFSAANITMKPDPLGDWTFAIAVLDITLISGQRTPTPTLVFRLHVEPLAFGNATVSFRFDFDTDVTAASTAASSGGITNGPFASAQADNGFIEFACGTPPCTVDFQVELDATPIRVDVIDAVNQFVTSPRAPSQELTAYFGATDAMVLPDVTGDAYSEAAVVREGSVRVETRNGNTGVPLSDAVFLADPFVPAGIIAVTDVNGNSASEIGALGIDDTDTIRLRVVDGATGQGIRNITYYSSGHDPIGLAEVGDVSGNGAPEASVLVARQSDSRIFVQMRDVLTGTNAIGKNIAFFDESFTPLGLAVLPDIDSSGSDELAVFATRNSDGRGVVEIREADGSPGNTRIWYLDANFTPRAIAIGDDADNNGVPEIAMLADRASDGRIVIERRNASGPPATTRHWYFSAGWQVIDFAAVSDTSDADNLPEYAVLAIRNDGKPAVELRNAGNPKAAFRRFFMNENFVPLSVTDFGDTNGNGTTNLGVLAARSNDGRIRLELRDARGASNTKNIWFAP